MPKLRLTALIVGLLACIVFGSSDTRLLASRFDGEKLVNRYQLAVVLERVLHRSRRVQESILTAKSQYPDVPKAYDAAVTAVTSTGILLGRDALFLGKRIITRYELAQTLQRLLKRIAICRPAINQALIPSDIPGRHPARDATFEMLRHGLMKTYDGKFHGRLYVSRYEFASIAARLARLLELPAEPTPFDFEDLAERHWAYEDIALCCATGLLHDMGTTSEESKAPATDEDAKETVHPTPLSEEVEEELQPLDVEMEYKLPVEAKPVAVQWRTLN